MFFVLEVEEKAGISELPSSLEYRKPAQETNQPMYDSLLLLSTEGNRKKDVSRLRGKKVVITSCNPINSVPAPSVGPWRFNII